MHANARPAARQMLTALLFMFFSLLSDVTLMEGTYPIGGVA